MVTVPMNSDAIGVNRDTELGLQVNLTLLSLKLRLSVLDFYAVCQPKKSYDIDKMADLFELYHNYLVQTDRDYKKTYEKEGIS